MMWINQSNDRDGRMGGSPQPVNPPARHEGVGNALRSAYLPRASDLPPDFADLLARLR